MTDILFNQINIIGLGIIGGSLAKICKKQNISKKISGFDIDQNQIKFGLENQIIDQIFDLNKPIDDELIIICSPLSSYNKIFTKLKEIISDKTVIIDIGSLKEFTIPLAQEILSEKAKNFVPCHPIAGSDKSGVENSLEDLFLNKKAIITPSAINYENLIKKIALFWQKIGSIPEILDAKEHDKIFALVSHLPQFLSFITKEDIQTDDELLKRHLRLQNSNPQIWQEIFSLNQENIKFYLQDFLKNIDKLIKDNSALNRRSLIVSAFLNIPDIKKYQKFSGTGFQDFVAISKASAILSDQKNVETLNFLKKLKEKIANYDFK